MSSIPDFTERQAAAWPGAIARLVAAGATVPESPHRWAIAYHEETRPGRGHFIDATYVDGEQFAQIQMDVYGHPSTSLAVLTWVHSDSDEECDCEPCEAERAAEDEDCIGAVARLVAPPTEGDRRVHNHRPWRPMCNERRVEGRLRGACLNDDGSDR